MDNFVRQLVELRNEDETAWLKTRKEILDYFFESSPPGVRDILYDEFNYLNGDVDRSNEREKKNL